MRSFNTNHQASTKRGEAHNSRIVIEQAKGMIAEREGLTMEAAFNRLRGHARNHNLRLGELAGNIIDGTLAAASLDPTPKSPTH